MCLPIGMRYRGRCTPFKGPVSAHLRVHESACVFTELARLLTTLAEVSCNVIHPKRFADWETVVVLKVFGTNAAISKYFLSKRIKN